MALALVPPVLIFWILWLAPLGPLTAARAALSARDFTALWGAGHATIEYGTALLSDPTAFTAFLRSNFGEGIPNQIWPYPPTALLLAVPVAMLPFGPGLILYSVAGVSLLGLSLWGGGLRPAACAAILLSPAVADTVMAGQNGAISGALLVGGLLLVDRRPILAGALIGGLVLKPQLALLLPLCLLAGRKWRALTTAGLTSLTIVSFSILIFGIASWVEYLNHAQPMMTAYIEAPWQSNPAQIIFTSVFMAARSLGADVTTAHLLQAIAICCCAVAAWRAWRRADLDAPTRMALTVPLAFIAAPWVHTYDMPALAAAIVVMFSRCRPALRPVLAVGWFWPGAMMFLPMPNVLALVSTGSIAWLAGAAAQPRMGRS